jgi:hypothetical protein
MTGALGQVNGRACAGARGRLVNVMENARLWNARIAFAAARGEVRDGP